MQGTPQFLPLQRRSLNELPGSLSSFLLTDRWWDPQLLFPINCSSKSPDPVSGNGFPAAELGASPNLFSTPGRVFITPHRQDQQTTTSKRTSHWNRARLSSLLKTGLGQMCSGREEIREPPGHSAPPPHHKVPGQRWLTRRRLGLRGQMKVWGPAPHCQWVVSCFG